MARFLVVLLLIGAALGCGRHRGPSKAYSEAKALFDTVVSQKGEEAFDDARIGDVERLLGEVPSQSVDAPYAAELKQQIADGKVQAAERKRQMEAMKSAPAAPALDPWANWKPAPAEKPAAEEPPDAGAPHPVPGMTVEELKARFSDCFSFKQNIGIPEHGRHDVWSMSSSEACRKAHPGQEDQLLVIDEPGKTIMGTAPVSAIQTRYLRADGGEAPPPK